MKDESTLIPDGWNAFDLRPEMAFSEAGRLWLDFMGFAPEPGQERSVPCKVGYISHRSLTSLREYVRALGRYFDDKQLCKITASDLRAYQQGRASGALSGVVRPNRKRGAAANKINQEIQTLIRILTRAGVWGMLSDNYMPLQRTESDVGRALTPEEQRRFLAVAGSRPRWAFVYHYSVLALNTTLSTNELRGLHLGDIDLEQGILMVRSSSAKNKYRMRTVQIDNEETMASLRWLIQRANNAGASAHAHFLMPYRIGSAWHVTRAMSVHGFTRDWAVIRKEAGLPWLRPYDLRHSAITRFAEAGTPIAVIMAMAGHVSERMSQHYTHVSMAAQRKAMRSVTAAVLPMQQGRMVPIASDVGTNPQRQAMIEAAELVRDTGIDVETALQIVMGVHKRSQSQTEDQLQRSAQK